MAISPLEANGTIGRMQDFNILKQNEDHKPMMDQSNIQNAFRKEVMDKTEQVHHADDTENNAYNYDAKEKGNGQYSNHQKREKKNNEDKKDKFIIKGQNHFDIKI